MRRIAITLLSIGIIFSICGCASNGNSGTLETMPNEIETSTTAEGTNIQSKEESKDIISEGDVCDSYLTSVELSLDNISDYFEFISVPDYNDRGESKNFGSLYIICNTFYDEGFVFYSSNATITFTDPVGKEITFSLASGYDSVAGYKMPINTDACVITKVSGTVDLLKPDSITSSAIIEGIQGTYMELTLKNGTKITREPIGDRWY